MFLPSRGLDLVAILPVQADMSHRLSIFVFVVFVAVVVSGGLLSLGTPFCFGNSLSVRQIFPYPHVYSLAFPNLRLSWNCMCDSSTFGLWFFWGGGCGVGYLCDCFGNPSPSIFIDILKQELGDPHGFVVLQHLFVLDDAFHYGLA